ncbi:urease accessory protein UreD [Halalkalibacter alkalisediminis]|uniref:Urease accessory protein UreD n=1 Tax=Halalkalibacter alkalisediminis TaxID=935616 RepID=A0ABV6NK10_9BACI|nr:urease accessory protein UreD [Halalkalibacter alkalisediminis]
MQKQLLAKPTKKLNKMQGELGLTFEKKGALTRLTKSHHSSPLKASKALYLDETGSATVYLMETSGGMVEGDVNKYRITIGNDSHVSLIPQSSTKIYPSRLDLPCRQSVDLMVGENASVRWLPETTIPFEDSIFLADTKIDLEPNSSLIFSEIFSSGRQKSAESFAFDRFSSKTQILIEGKLIAFDHLNLVQKESPYFHIGMFEDCTYMGTIWYVDPAAANQNFETFLTDFHQAKNHRFGFSRLDHYGVHFRWLSNDLCLLKEQMNELIQNL